MLDQPEILSRNQAQNLRSFAINYLRIKTFQNYYKDFSQINKKKIFSE